jgi:hypothetical protein
MPLYRVYAPGLHYKLIEADTSAEAMEQVPLATSARLVIPTSKGVTLERPKAKR